PWRGRSGVGSAACGMLERYHRATRPPLPPLTKGGSRDLLPGRLIGRARLFVGFSQLVDFVLAGKSEAAQAARVLFGKERLERTGAPERISAADEDSPARQRRSGKDRPQIDFFEHGAGCGIEGDQPAAADGGKI